MERSKDRGADKTSRLNNFMERSKKREADA